MGFDSAPIRTDKALFDLALSAACHPGLEQYLCKTPVAGIIAQLESGQPPDNVGAVEWEEWQDCFQAYLDTFGHAIYNLDFATPVPADAPGPLLDTFKLYLSGKGVNPHKRQQNAEIAREQAVNNFSWKTTAKKIQDLYDENYSS